MIWNPGSLPPSLTLDKLRKPHSSVPANPLLAESLYLAKYIERMGTGTGDMIQDCRNAGLPEPDFSLTDGFVTTVHRKLGRAFEAVGGKRESELPTQSPTQSTDPVVRLLDALKDGDKTAGDLRVVLKIKHRPTFRANYLHPALSEKLIEYTIPDKPNSRLQKYRLTKKGAGYLKKQGKK